MEAHNYRWISTLLLCPILTNGMQILGICPIATKEKELTPTQVRSLEKKRGKFRTQNAKPLTNVGNVGFCDLEWQFLRPVLFHVGVWGVGVGGGGERCRVQLRSTTEEEGRKWTRKLANCQSSHFAQGRNWTNFLPHMFPLFFDLLQTSVQMYSNIF